MSNEQFETLQSLLSVLMPTLAGFAGVLIGAWLTHRRETSARKHQFLVRQLNDLYAPLLGMRTEIRLRSELRAKISREADAAWRELVSIERQINHETVATI